MAGVITLFTMVPATPALAIAEPTEVSLEGIVIFQDLIDDYDFLAIVPYNIAFITEPDENINETYIFQMLSSDNYSELGFMLASPSYNGGYGPGVVAFYFSATTNMTWGEDYIFRVQQNPTYYSSPQYWDFLIGDSNYSTEDDQEAALKAKIVDSATFLTTAFETALLSQSESGNTILSTYGELYYLSVIPGLQTMCPSLFSVQLENPDYTKRTWATTLADTLETKYSGTFVYDFMTGFAGLFEMETSAAMGIFSLLLFVILVGISVWKFKASMLAAFIDGYTLLLLLMLMGMFPMVAAGGIAFCSVLLGGVILFLNKA